MLGYMEQGPLYNAINFNFVAWYGQGWIVNTTVSNSVLATFLCPSDDLAPNAPNNRQWAGNTNNYFASRGTTTDPWSADSTGVFAHSRAIGVEGIRDGTANTIAFAEGLLAGDERFVP